jgi:uncharacterized membrane protein YhaH (DUF805 family)
MRDEIQDYADRPKRYDNIDGTGEMFMGLMLLGFALEGCLEAKLPENSSRWMHGLVIYGVMIPVLAFGYWIRRVIKKHITWPRTGYAAFPRDGKSWWIAMLAVFLVAIVLGLGLAFLTGFARRHHAMSLPGIVMLASFVVVYGFWIFRMGREYPWKWLVLLLMALGLLAIGLPVRGDYFQVGRQVALFVGLAWLGSGAGTLYSYIRHTQPPASEAE